VIHGQLGGCQHSAGWLEVLQGLLDVWSRSTEVSKARAARKGGVQPRLGSLWLPQGMQGYRVARSPLPPPGLCGTLGLQRVGAGNRAQHRLALDHGPGRGSMGPLEASAPDKDL
jgi:hypothetical protein